MRRVLPVLAAVLALLATTSLVQAGGRARVSIDQSPKGGSVVAGQAFQIAFTVKPEWSGIRSTEPIVRAVRGDQTITVAAVPLNVKNHYQATVTLPAEGDWTVTVDSRFCQTVMDPLKLKADAAKSKQS